MMTQAVEEEARQALARAVRDACVQAALDGYEQAGMSGLCAEGRWEMAVDSMRSLDLTAVLSVVVTKG
jgi:hypothetical protein